MSQTILETVNKQTNQPNGMHPSQMEWWTRNTTIPQRTEPNSFYSRFSVVFPVLITDTTAREKNLAFIIRYHILFQCYSCALCKGSNQWLTLVSFHSQQPQASRLVWFPTRLRRLFELTNENDCFQLHFSMFPVSEWVHMVSVCMFVSTSLLGETSRTPRACNIDIDDKVRTLAQKHAHRPPARSREDIINQPSASLWSGVFGVAIINYYIKKRIRERLRALSQHCWAQLFREHVSMHA